MIQRSDNHNPAGSSAGFARMAREIPLLSREEERILAMRWRDHRDEDALARLILAHAKLVVALARRYRGAGFQFDDLVQTGNVGLMDAAARFDPDLRVRFSTYARFWAHAAIRQYVLRNSSIVRPGMTNREKTIFYGLRRTQARVDRDVARGSEIDREAEVARLMSATVDEISRADRLIAGRDQSLNDPLPGTEMTLESLISDDSPTPEDIAVARNERAAQMTWLLSALEGLSDRERFVVEQRLLTQEARTLAEVGAELGLSKERIRQIERNAQEKLRLSVKREMASAGHANRHGDLVGGQPAVAS